VAAAYFWGGVLCVAAPDACAEVFVGGSVDCGDGILLLFVAAVGIFLSWVQSVSSFFGRCCVESCADWESDVDSCGAGEVSEC
jgi:hypothetical protein